MKILYYDCFCGISGDMNLGALIDLGVDAEHLKNELSKLHIDAEFSLEIKKGLKNGISGTKVDVILHHHHHEGGHQHHEHHGHHHHEEGHHHHRNLHDIEEIIDKSDLSDAVKQRSLDMFKEVAKAEAKVHGKSLYEVHFHEVGAVDSIVDMIGAAICLEALGVDKILGSTIQLGGGFVKCAHGVIPVPAPATVEILKDAPVKTGLVNFETTTPTGAAILASNVEEFTDKMEFSIDKIGYGLGTKDAEVPNALRVYLGTAAKKEVREEQFILETNIDDMNPELYGYVEEKLFANGALDVFKTPIIMKKGRPAVKLSILVNSKKEKDVLEVIFKETTSIGLRKFKVEKVMLQREYSKVRTSYGEVTLKSSFYEGERVKYKAEYEDCRKLALEQRVSIKKIYQEVDRLVGE